LRIESLDRGTRAYLYFLLLFYGKIYKVFDRVAGHDCLA